MRRDLVFNWSKIEVGGGDEYGAQGEIDAGAEAKGGEDGSELAGFSEGLD